MPTFIKRLEVIEAIQFTGRNADEVHRWTHAKSSDAGHNGGPDAAYLTLYLGDRVMSMNPGEWIVRDGIHALYTLSDEHFRKLYEESSLLDGLLP